MYSDTQLSGSILSDLFRVPQKGCQSTMLDHLMQAVENAKHGWIVGAVDAIT